MKPEPLDAEFAKIERSVSQIDDLDSRIKAFFKTNPHGVDTGLNADGTEQIWRFKLNRKLPTEFSIIIGEILHNLRSPLDQAACAIALQNNRSENGVCFPFGQDKNAFETALGNQKKLPGDAINIIHNAKPYKGGDDLLWALHDLNRQDKHRVGVVPINMPAETSVSHIIFSEGVPIVVGCKTGKHLNIIRRPTPEEIARMSKPTALYDARPGRIVCGDAGTPGDESLEFMTTTPGAKFEADFYPSLSVAFTGVGLEGKPVVTVLNEFRQLVEGILLTFKGRFFP